MFTAAAVVAALAIVVAVGQSRRPDRHAGPAIHPTESRPNSAEARVLRQWAKFPVDASPRPVVLTSPTIIEPAAGYPNNEDKLAFLSGNIDLAAPLPSSPPTMAGYPIIPAADALSALQTGSGKNPEQGETLQVSDVQLTRSPLRH